MPSSAALAAMPSSSDFHAKHEGPQWNCVMNGDEAQALRDRASFPGIDVVPRYLECSKAATL